jgi:hypothetical protein
MADCRPLSTASGYFVSTLSRHLAFENRRCLETPWWERCVARRSIAPCRCLDRRGESVSPRGRRWEACCENLAQSGRDLALRPILSRARLRFRLFDSPRWLLQPNQHRNAQTCAAFLMYATHSTGRPVGVCAACSLQTPIPSTRTARLVVLRNFKHGVEVHCSSRSGKCRQSYAARDCGLSFDAVPDGGGR